MNVRSASSLRRSSRYGLLAIVVITGLFSTFVTRGALAQQPVPPVDPFPQFDTRAWFVAVQPDGKKVIYHAANLKKVPFKELMLVHADATDGKSIGTMLALATSQPGVWFFIMDMPTCKVAGTISAPPQGSPHQAVWCDSKGNSGYLFTTP